jgi:hypothetical protein
MKFMTLESQSQVLRKKPHCFGIGDNGVVQFILEKMLNQTHHVANQVWDRLPSDFPGHISEPILEGMISLAKQKLDRI